MLIIPFTVPLFALSFSCAPREACQRESRSKLYTGWLVESVFYGKLIKPRPLMRVVQGVSDTVYERKKYANRGLDHEYHVEH